MSAKIERNWNRFELKIALVLCIEVLSIEYTRWTVMRRLSKLDWATPTQLTASIDFASIILYNWFDLSMTKRSVKVRAVIVISNEQVSARFSLTGVTSVLSYEYKWHFYSHKSEIKKKPATQMVSRERSNVEIRRDNTQRSENDREREWVIEQRQHNDKAKLTFLFFFLSSVVFLFVSFHSPSFHLFLSFWRSFMRVFAWILFFNLKKQATIVDFCRAGRPECRTCLRVFISVAFLWFVNCELFVSNLCACIYVCPCQWTSWDFTSND